MAICPFAVRGGALCGEFSVHTIDVVHQHLRGDDAGPDASLRQRVLRELLFFGTFGVQLLLTGDRLRVGTKQLHGFI